MGLLGEVEENDPDATDDVRAMIAEMKKRFGPEKMAHFLIDLKEAVPLAREANEITQTMRPKDKLHLIIEFSYDVMAFPADQPELVLRLMQTQKDKTEVTCDVWDFRSFKERLQQMRLLYKMKRQEGGRRSIY